VKIQSDLLTDYWGTPIYIGANVLLPRGYGARSSESERYPVIYLQGHFPGDNPFGFVEGGGDRFSDWWLGKDAPRVVVVELRHETPYFDDSYAVNSENLGPYGDAIVTELIPAIEDRFRVVPKAWARTLTGGSTGGWEALAQQIFYPKVYGGTWGLCPDSLSFTYHQLVNVYEDPNAYYTYYDWERVQRPSARTVQGDTLWTMPQENHFELALGTHGRSQLGQWDIWQAVYGPQGADGYPAAIWDKQTGKIDHDVAEEWRSMDLTEYVEANWPSIGPELKGKLRVYVGDDDTFFLNNGVSVFQGVVEALRRPRAHSVFEYGKDAPHCWGPWGSRLVQMMADVMYGHAPVSSDGSWWHEGGGGEGPDRVSSARPYGRRGHGV
jgi:hypothetical protein